MVIDNRSHIENRPTIVQVFMYIVANENEKSIPAVVAAVPVWLT